MVQNIINSTRFDAVMKITFVVVLLPWCVWVTVGLFEQQAFASRGDRFTKLEALELKEELTEHLREAEIRIDMRIDRLPPEDWRKQIVEAGADAARLELMIRDYEKDFSRSFVRKDELQLILDNVFSQVMGRKMYNAPAGPTSLKQ